LKRSKKTSSARPRWRPSPARAKVVWTVAGLVAFATALTAGMHLLRAQLLSSPPYSTTAARVRLTAAPSWLPRDVAAGLLADLQAVAGGRSVYDDDLAEAVHAAAAADPWVAEVRRVAKHHDGHVTVDVSYRRPFVLVRSAEPRIAEPVVVDAEAVRLPLSPYRLKPGRTIIVSGVAGVPPAPGRTWTAPDLADALRLMHLLKDKPYVNEVTIIDVRNHEGRISQAEPTVVLVAQVGRGRRTEVRFGRFPVDDADYCVSPARQLAFLDEYVEANGGRLSGRNAFIDLRYDRPYVSVH